MGAYFIHLHAIGETATGLASLAFFPLTYMVYPWQHNALGVQLWMVGVGSLLLYPLSNLVLIFGTRRYVGEEW